MRIIATLTAIATFTGARCIAAQRPTWLQLAPRPSYSDSLPDAAHATIATTIASAEAEGLRWPRRLERCGQVVTECTVSFASDGARTCVSARSTDPRLAATMRSGEIVVGGSDISVAGARRVWWVPMHPATGDSLVVRAVLLASPADTVRFAMAEWSRGLPDGEFYYLTHFPWPKAGHWLVVATSGPDWGCFVL